MSATFALTQLMTLLSHPVVIFTAGPAFFSGLDNPKTCNSVRCVKVVFPLRLFIQFIPRATLTIPGNQIFKINFLGKNLMTVSLKGQLVKDKALYQMKTIHHFILGSEKQFTGSSLESISFRPFELCNSLGMIYLEFKIKTEGIHNFKTNLEIMSCRDYY